MEEAQKHRIKRLIAKEIIILFSSTAILGLIILTIWIRNQYYYTGKVERINDKFLLFSNKLDSIQSILREGYITSDDKENTVKRKSKTKLNLTGALAVLKENSKRIPPPPEEDKTKIDPNKPLSEVSNKEELPPPPPKELMIEYKNAKLKLSELLIEQKDIAQKVYSSKKIREIFLWISISIGVIIYPLRFILFVLIWSFRTLKQN